MPIELSLLEKREKYCLSQIMELMEDTIMAKQLIRLRIRYWEIESEKCNRKIKRLYSTIKSLSHEEDMVNGVSE